MATTPPISSVIRTPSTPRHAGEASRHYTTRKITRYISTRNIRATVTPPPDTQVNRKVPTTKLSKIPSPHSSSVSPQPPASLTQTSPRQRVLKGKKSSRSSKMQGESSAGGDFSLEDQSGINLQPAGNVTNANTHHMLPTPVSLPRKKTVSRNVVDAAARVLFPSRPENIDEAMPTPRKNRKGRKNVGFSLYSSMEDDGTSSEEKIQIYTDSKDKVPEMDVREDNPFLERPNEQPPPPEPVKARSSKKRKTDHGVETNPQIEEAFNRDEGMVYVFRGKKMYRKFPQDSESEREDTPTAEDRNPSANEDPAIHNLRPLTRSSIKPRLLFPTAKQHAERTAAAIAEEEAPTDIEDHAMIQPEESLTPVKKIFAPATPPTTGHVTRSATRKARDETVSPADLENERMDLLLEKQKKPSPFDGWARTKAGASGGKGRKRGGDLMERSDGDGGKRIRHKITS